MARIKLAFGLNHAIPEDAQAAWGCRAIADKRDGIDVLWDRQDLQGTDEAKAALKHWLNDEGAFTAWRENAERLLGEYVIDPTREKQHTLYEDGRGIVVGNTNASYGYLYVAAWLKPGVVLYECGICSCYHPWEWDGDCRDDANRYGGPDDYAAQHGISEANIEVRSMDERVAADIGKDET